MDDHRPGRDRGTEPGLQARFNEHFFMEPSSGSTMQYAISAKDLYYTYCEHSSGVEALKGLDLEIGRGEIFGFLGPNGAGKTTTIKLILGILRPQKGSIFLSGKDPSVPAARASAGYMPEIADYYRYLTPVELLRMYGDVFRMGKKALSARIPELMAVVGLENDANRIMRGFSKGMMQKVSFAQALINDPDVLILDEPMSGLDPVARARMRETLVELRTRGKTIFFSSHELSEVETVSDRIGILNKGRMVIVGALKDVLGGKGETESLERYFLKIIGEAG